VRHSNASSALDEAVEGAAGGSWLVSKPKTPRRARSKPTRRLPDAFLQRMRGFPQWMQLALTSLGVAFAYASLWVVVRLLIGNASPVWSVHSLDTSVMCLLVGLATIAIVWPGLRLVYPHRASAFQRSLRLLVGITGIIALYVAYASFRNQSRLTAETDLNSEAMQLYGLEMENKELRCLYFNYGHSDPPACLTSITTSSENWSRAILYVEEVWFVLQKAKEDQIQWGSTYASSIKFWADDVSKDPTGLFSYYLISTTESRAEAAQEMALAGVSIPDLCAGFGSVLWALRSREAAPTEFEGAAKECIAVLREREASGLR
jgi:hypothetical protein